MKRQLLSLGLFLRTKHQRDPHVHSDWEIELFRHDADHDTSLSIHLDRSAYHIGIASEAAHPVAVIQENYLVSTLLIFIRREGSARGGIDSEELKQVAGNGCSFYPFGLPLGENQVCVTVGGNSVQTVSLPGQVDIVGRGKAVCIFSLSVTNFAREHEPIQIWERKGMQQERIDCTESSRICTDAQCQREYGNRGESTILQQHSRGITKILHEVVHRPVSLATTIRNVEPPWDRSAWPVVQGHNWPTPQPRPVSR